MKNTNSLNMRASSTLLDNRSVISKIKVPNVVSYVLLPRNYSKIGEIFEINLGKRKMIDISRIKSNTMMNRYLQRQFKRLQRYLIAGEIEKFNFLSKLLIRNSISYRTYGLMYVYSNIQKVKFPNMIIILKKITKLCKELRTDLHYDRLWIDKKPGDYARPLGVPQLAWRVYGHMITRILEIYSENTGLQVPHQHGGKVYHGTKTALIDLYRKLHSLKPKEIYEFDIKGYFDHLTHKSMISLFEGTWLRQPLLEMLEAKPADYHLPDKEVDKGYQEYLKQTLPPNPNADIFEREWKVTETHGPAMMKIDYVKSLNKIPINVDYNNLTEYEKEFYKMRGLITALQTYSIKYKDGIYSSNDPIQLLKFFELRRLQEQGQILLNRSRKQEYPLERAYARDSWKELDLPNQGVPQGSNFGPLLSSLVLGQILKEYNSLIYMDDGIIFNSKEPTDLEEKFKSIGVEKAPDKSRTLNSNQLARQGIKFLGTRIYYRNNQVIMESETRRGIKRPLVNLTKEQLIHYYSEMVRYGYITQTHYEWLKLEENRMRDFYINLSIKYDFFGKLLSEAYSPVKVEREMSKLIESGRNKAIAQIKRATGSISNALYKKQEIEYVDSEKRVRIKEAGLNNLTTFSTALISELFRMNQKKTIGFDRNKIKFYYKGKSRKTNIDK